MHVWYVSTDVCNAFDLVKVLHVHVSSFSYAPKIFSSKRLHLKTLFQAVPLQSYVVIPLFWHTPTYIL